jgi:RNA polymerase sigma-70 factor (ECF subfamily)
VIVPAELFVQHLAERLPDSGAGVPLEQVLDGLRLSDLSLACACAHRVRGADAALQREHLGRLPEMLRRQFRGTSAALIEDACQRVAEKLLLGNPAGRPHLLTYTGEGALAGWVRTIGVRMVMQMLRPQGNRPQVDPEPWEPDPAPDVEEDLARSERRTRLREVVREVARALSPEEKLLLKHHYKDGLSTAKLANLHGGSQPTMWRKLDGIRQKLLAGSKRLLRERFGIDGEELGELISGLESRFEVTLSTVFGSGEADAA